MSFQETLQLHQYTVRSLTLCCLWVQYPTWGSWWTCAWIVFCRQPLHVPLSCQHHHSTTQIWHYAFAMRQTFGVHLILAALNLTHLEIIQFLWTSIENLVTKLVFMLYFCRMIQYNCRCFSNSNERLPLCRYTLPFRHTICVVYVYHK